VGYGLLITNNDGDVLIDSDYPHYHFLGKYTHSSVTQIPDVSGGSDASVTAGGNSPNQNKGMENMPSKGEIYVYSVPVNGANPPMCFIKPTSTGSSAPYAGIILTKQSGTNWEIRVFQSTVTSASPVLYCFSPLSQVSNSTSTTYGLKTFNSSSVVTFDSRFKPLKAIGGGNITSPGLAHAGSTGSGWVVSLNVNASPVSTGFSTTSNSANDLIYYCPSLAHACQQYTHEEDDSGTYDWESYVWARGDIWWCFYRSCFRIGSYYGANYNLEANYGVFARGHIYEHKGDTSSVFAGLILGALTGGVYFAAILAALVASGAFTSAGVDGGNYLPYENSYRNTSGNAFIISKASFYD
jgi:hypothetical protein